MCKLGKQTTRDVVSSLERLGLDRRARGSGRVRVGISRVGSGMGWVYCHVWVYIRTKKAIFHDSVTHYISINFTDDMAYSCKRHDNRSPIDF